MPLLEHAAFCNACGTAVRVGAKTTPATVPAAAATSAGPAGAPAADPGAPEDTVTLSSASAVPPAPDAERRPEGEDRA
jgi:hypothetical protein